LPRASLTFLLLNLNFAFSSITYVPSPPTPLQFTFRPRLPLISSRPPVLRDPFFLSSFPADSLKNCAILPRASPPRDFRRGSPLPKSPTPASTAPRPPFPSPILFLPPVHLGASFRDRLLAPPPSCPPHGGQIPPPPTFFTPPSFGDTSFSGLSPKASPTLEVFFHWLVLEYTGGYGRSSFLCTCLFSSSCTRAVECDSYRPYLNVGFFFPPSPLFLLSYAGALTPPPLLIAIRSPPIPLPFSAPFLSLVFFCQVQSSLVNLAFLES